MLDTKKALFFLGVLNICLLSGGCFPAKQTRVAAVAFTAEDVFQAASKQSDLNLVRAGTPAYLMLMDGLIEAYPDNKDLLIGGCRAYTSFSSAFLEDSDPEEAARFYAKARSYGFRALSDKEDLEQARSGSLEEFSELLQKYQHQDVPALFWTASSWASWIKFNPDNLEALADLPLLEAMMHRVLALDETYHYGGPHLLMAAYLAARPAIIGGDLEKAKKHFDRAITLSEGKLLMAKVLLARYYALPSRDRALFQRNLQDVLSAPVDQVPELTLTNALAKQKARELLEKMEEYFREIPQ
jgi:hypothetical protein